MEDPASRGGLPNADYFTLGIDAGESAANVRRALREILVHYAPERLGPARSVFVHKVITAYRSLRDAAGQPGYRERPNPERPAERARQTGESAFTERAGRRRVLIRDLVFEAALGRISGSITAAEPIGGWHPLTAVVIVSAEEARAGGIIQLLLPTCWPCSACGGSGQEGFFICPACDGEGIIEEQETVDVRIPPQLGDGTVVTLPLRGLGLHNFYLRLQLRISP